MKESLSLLSGCCYCPVYTTFRQIQHQKIYSYKMSCDFMNEMRDLLHKLFTCWDQYISTRPLALARMDYLGRSRRNLQEPTNLKSYRGPTTDSLHFPVQSNEIPYKKFILYKIVSVCKYVHVCIFMCNNENSLHYNRLRL